MLSKSPGPILWSSSNLTWFRPGLKGVYDSGAVFPRMTFCGLSRSWSMKNSSKKYKNPGLNWTLAYLQANTSPHKSHRPILASQRICCRVAQPRQNTSAHMTHCSGVKGLSLAVIPYLRVSGLKGEMLNSNTSSAT